jgi:hypothetical protein
MSPRQVRAGLLLCALLVAGALGALAAPAPPSASAKPASPPTKSEPSSTVAASQAGSQAVAAELAKGGGPVRPAVTPLPAGKRRVAIFDFDDTLKNGAPQRNRARAASPCFRYPNSLGTCYRGQRGGARCLMGCPRSVRVPATHARRDARSETSCQGG